jgi:hypothetical protein
MCYVHVSYICVGFTGTLFGGGMGSTRSSACERAIRIEHQRTCCYEALVNFQVGDSTACQVASHTTRKKRAEGCGELGFAESVEEHVLLRLLRGSVFSSYDPLHRVESLVERE